MIGKKVLTAQLFLAATAKRNPDAYVTQNKYIDNKKSYECLTALFCNLNIYMSTIVFLGIWLES
jgi:hypothetical protein